MAPLLQPSLSSVESTTSKSKSVKTKSMLHHLIYINLLIISLDITLLGIQYASLFYLQGSFKPAIYAVKLKLEFVILNQLIKSLSCRSSNIVSTVGSDVRHGSESDSGGISVTRAWNVQWPSPSTEDGRQLKSPNVAHLSSIEAPIAR
jgi:hypothetical protein